MDDQRGQIVFGADHIDTLVFNDSFTEFTQLIRGGPDSFRGRLINPSASHDRVDHLQKQPSEPTRDHTTNVVGNHRLTLVNVRTGKTAQQPMQLRADKTLGLDGGGDVRGTWSIKDSRLILDMPGLDITPAQQLDNGGFSGIVIGPARVLQNVAASRNRPAEKIQVRFTLTKTD